MAVKVGITDFGVCSIIKVIIKTWQTASCWVSHPLTVLLQCHRYAIVNLSLEQYHNEADALVPCSVVLYETWAWANKHKLKLQLKKWLQSGSPQLTNWCQLLLKSTLSSSTVMFRRAELLMQCTSVIFCSITSVLQCSESIHIILQMLHCLCHVARLVTDLLAWWQWEIL